MPHRDRSKFYELMFSTAAEGMIIANRGGTIEDANDRAVELFGYSVDELVGMNVDDLIPKHLAQKHRKQREGYVSEPRKRPMGHGYDLIAVRKDGGSFPIEISLNYMGEGEDLRVMALIMDVTVRKEQEAQIKMLNKTLEQRVKKRTSELRESQQLYQTVARNFPNGTINVFDREFTYVFVEGEELYRFGITSEKLVGMNYLDRLHEDLRPMIKKRLEAVLNGENQSFEVELNHQYYLINAVGLANEKGTVNRILMVEQNISAQKKAEEQVREALDKEKHLNELKSRFVSMASHEFRTPLSTVLSSLSLIEKYDKAGIEDKKGKHYKRIRSSVRHLTNILNDFLSLEKVETGKVNVNPSDFSLRQMITDLMDQQQEIAKPGQKLKLVYSGYDEICTDMHMLHIIINNLLSNAVKYSEANTEVTVTVTNEADALSLAVADQGIGIPESEQANMFSRFFRAKNALNIEGTGLGLNIIKRYLQMLRGTIYYTSETNVGTTFYVRIPQNQTE